VIRAAEQLPIEALPRLARALPADTVLFESPRGIVAYRVLDAQRAPIAWPEAQRTIADYLRRQQGTAAVRREMARLRASGEIVAHVAQRSPVGVQ